MSIIIQQDNQNDPLKPRIYRMINNNNGTFTYTRLNTNFSEYKNANGESDIFTNDTDFTNSGYRQIQEQRGGKKSKKSKKTKKSKKSKKSIKRRK